MASPYEARGGDCLADDEGDRRVLLVGLACLDIVNEVTTYPAEDSEIEIQEQLWSRGGNASNTSVVLSQLGVRVEYMGTLARHFLSNFITEDLQRFGVDFSRCVYCDDCKTPVSCVTTNASTGSRTILHGNKTLPELKCEDFDSINFKDYKWIHFEGRNISEVIKMIDVVDEYNRGLGDSSSPPIYISVEIEKPKWKAYVNDLLPKADLFFLSKDVAQAFDCPSGEECVLKFYNSIKPGAMIVCAWGEQGAWAIEGNGNVVRSSAYPPPRVVDTLGAGDTFNAASSPRCPGATTSCRPSLRAARWPAGRLAATVLISSAMLCHVISDLQLPMANQKTGRDSNIDILWQSGLCLYCLYSSSMAKCTGYQPGPQEQIHVNNIPTSYGQ